MRTDTLQASLGISLIRQVQTKVEQNSVRLLSEVLNRGNVLGYMSGPPSWSAWGGGLRSGGGTCTKG